MTTKLLLLVEANREQHTFDHTTDRPRSLGKLTGSLTMNKVSWFSFSKHLQSLLQDQPDN
jgi:hypothetical protein